MSITSHESAFKAACEALQIPGAVLAASNASGKFRYIKAFGKTARGEELSTDSVMLTGGCTNLMTTIAALQLVDRGLVCLDQDIAELLPELATLEVLEGFDTDGQPTLRKRRGIITMRQLLAHTSGAAYEFMDPQLKRLSQYRNNKDDSAPRSYIELISDALVFQPGENWAYSPGLGWAGKLIERLTNLSLEDYMRTNIWDPLQMRHVSFFPALDDELAKRRVSMSVRNEAGMVVPSSEKLPYQFFEARPEDDAYGGGGCWCSAESYLPLLQSLLTNDGRVLKPKLVDDMFRPQLGPTGKAALNQTAKHIDLFRQTFGRAFNMDIQVLDSGLGGDIGMKDEVGLQKAGTMAWLGLPNVFAWIDRESGLCGAYFSQLLPMGDAKVNVMAKLFQKAVYQKYEEYRTA